MNENNDPTQNNDSTQGNDSPPDSREKMVCIRQEVGKAIVGQEAAITGLVIGLLTGGHVLLEGVPGVAKTLLVRSLATVLNLQTNRVQFTPDLMPGDVTGSLIFDSNSRELKFRPGPIFTNLLLADEINRTPPKTQSALLEAMEEKQVTIDGVSRQLPDPFLVVATQNPVEYAGTYPLPEAQLDRFLLKITVDLPDRDNEIEILTRHCDGFNPRDLSAAGLKAVAGSQDLQAARQEVNNVHVSPEIMAYIVDLVQATRQQPSVQLGVSPRGAKALLQAARAWAWLSNDNYVSPDHVKSLLMPTLRHRIRVRSEAQMEGVTPQTVLQQVLSTTPVPR